MMLIRDTQVTLVEVMKLGYFNEFMGRKPKKWDWEELFIMRIVAPLDGLERTIHCSIVYLHDEWITHFTLRRENGLSSLFGCTDFNRTLNLQNKEDEQSFLSGMRMLIQNHLEGFPIEEFMNFI